MITFHLLHLRNCPIFKQLQIEEALLRADSRNWCLLNEGSSPAIVMGISGKEEQLINLANYRKNPLPVIRRFSGGGTVVVDEDTTFVTWICNTAELNVTCCPQKILAWTEKFYQPVFAIPEFKVKENDYVIGSRKFGGNAQYLCKQRWLHHTSLLWDYEKEKMEYLQMPSRVPKYRANRSHEDFLCALKEYLHDKQGLIHALKKGLNKQFHVVEIEQVHEILDRPHRKATHYLHIQ